MLRCFIFDIEATCWRNAGRKSPEIIELGGVLIGSDGREFSRFHRFVHPHKEPRLSAFCRELTGVEQADIDRASELPEVLEDLQSWCKDHHPDFFVSWGNFDVHQIRKEAITHQLDLKWLPAHIDLKRDFAEIYHLQNHAGVKDALGLLHLEFKGEEHRALTDAINTARIFQMLLHQWPFLQ